MRRVLGVLLVLVLLAGAVVGGVYAFDAPVRNIVSDRVAAELEASVPFPERPRVTVEGHPLVWHLIAREFPAVRVQARELPVQADGTTTIPLYDLDVTLTDVTYQPDAVRAATLAGTGWLDYADLSRVADARIGRADEQRLFFERDVEFMSLNFTGRLLGRPVLDAEAQTLGLTDVELDLAGVPIPPQASQSLVDTILRPVPVELPHGLRLDGLALEDRGIHVTMAATDVELVLG